MAEVKKVYAIASDAVTAAGIGIEPLWNAVINNNILVKKHVDQETYYASTISDASWADINTQTSSISDISPFEQLCIYSAKRALDQRDISLDDTALILSTTKGNIEWLNTHSDERIGLSSSANIVATALGIKSKPVVIAHACVSGAVALQYGEALVSSGRYKNVIVVGCDRFTPFVLNGFQSFQAIADEPCRPFDKDRKGINLGEAVATIVLSANGNTNEDVQLLSGATSNDANHISGPSRTGEELADAIKRAISIAGIQADDIDMISAHGTATPYNDEMEAKAISLSGANTKPIHSLKSYIGHTLGAAGVLESVMIIESFKQQQLIPSIGYTEHGVSAELNITQEATPTKINFVLKTASGFGGCNAALVWGRS